MLLKLETGLQVRTYAIRNQINAKLVRTLSELSGY
jgi:hypothetical protein